MMGAVAFVCAMPMELRPLTKQLDLKRAEIGGVTVRQGRLGGRDVVAIVTGMGTDLARRGMERLLRVVEPDRVVVVGITGAVENETPIGTLMLPEIVIDSATGGEYRPHPLGSTDSQGAMWTTDILTPTSELAALRARGVVCLDMETAAIAACCEQRNIPWSVFRAVSDRASDGSVDQAVFRLSNQDGTPNWRAIASFFARHPGRLPTMAKLAKGSKLATERAAAAAIEAVSSL